MKFKKAFVSLFETIFIILLFVMVIPYMTIFPGESLNSFKLTTSSALNTIYLNDANRAIFINEDLTKATNSQDWTLILSQLDVYFNNYELIISDNINSKTIKSCNANFEKYFVEKIITIDTGFVYSFRKLTLGVCF